MYLTPKGSYLPEGLLKSGFEEALSYYTRYPASRAHPQDRNRPSSPHGEIPVIRSGSTSGGVYYSQKPGI